MIKSIGFYRKMFRLSRKIHHVFDVKIFSKINTFSNDEWNYIDRYVTKFVKMNTTIGNAQYEILNQILSRRTKRS